MVYKVAGIIILDLSRTNHVESSYMFGFFADLVDVKNQQDVVFLMLTCKMGWSFDSLL